MNWKTKLGILLMIISVPAFLAIPVLPFLDIDSETKITLGTILLIIGEVLFWSGGLLVGKELFTKYKSYFNPKNWFKKDDKKDDIV
ncbi:MAG: hypothetical protein C0595_11465 [Marinilabiliales bacterium]|nr:MAG: hypothetical protein C0595_11465 [Marinilabiliales bacterium]